MVNDPVCGMEVNEKATAYKSIHGNDVYHFCSSACQSEFDKNQEKYVQRISTPRHASHYGGYCGVSGCGAPARGLALYFYLGLLILLLLVLFLSVL